MSEVVINVTKVDEVVTINVTPNVTQILVNTNSGGGGAVDSVNGQTGIVVLDTDDISDSSTTNKFVTSAEKTAITHSNRSVLDAITESFTTALKTAYDNAVNWITTNGTNILNHLSSTSNPHSVTKSQVGLSNVPNTDTTTTANITDSTNKRFVTDANLVVIGNTSGSNNGDNATNTTSNAYADAKVENNLTASTTIAPSKTAVNTALNLKVDKSDFEDWTDFSGTSVITGFVTPNITFLRYRRIGKGLTIRGRVTGISNSLTGPTLTHPFTTPNFGPSQPTYSLTYTNNNISSPTSGLVVAANNSNLIQFFRDGSFSTNWSNTGTLTIAFEITLIIQ